MATAPRPGAARNPMTSAKTAIRPFIRIEALSDPRNRVNRTQEPSTIIGNRPAALEPAPLWQVSVQRAGIAVARVTTPVSEVAARSR